MKNLYWKESREIRTVVVLCCAIIAILTFFYGLYGAFAILFPFSMILGGDTFAREKNIEDFLFTKPVSKNRIITAKLVTAIAAIIIGFVITGAVILFGIWYRSRFGTVQYSNAPYFLSGNSASFSYMLERRWFVFAVVLLLALFSSSFILSTVGLDSVTSLIAGAILFGGYDGLISLFCWLPHRTFDNYSFTIISISNAIFAIVSVYLGYRIIYVGVKILKRLLFFVFTGISSLLILFPLIVLVYLFSPGIWVFTISSIVLFIVCIIIYVVMIQKNTESKGLSPKKAFFKVGLILLILAWCINGVFQFTTGFILRKAKIEAQNKGITLSIADIVPPPVPDNENGALVLNKAFTILDQLEKQYKNEWKYMPSYEMVFLEDFVKNEKLSVSQKKSIETIMETPDFKEFFAMVEKAVNMEKCRFNINYDAGYSFMLFTHLGKIETVAEILSLRIYLLLDEKRYTEAIALSKTLMKLGDCLKDEPIYLSQIRRRSGIDWISVKQIETILNSNAEIRTKDCKDLILEIDRKDRTITRGLEGHISMSAVEWKRIYKNVLFIREILFDEYDESHRLLKKLFGPVLTWPLRPILNLDYTFYIQKMTELVEMNKKPYFLVKNESMDFDERFDNLRTWLEVYKHFISLMSLPGDRSVELAKDNVSLDSLRIALALRIYKNEHGIYPVTLDSLVPGILPDLPKDPFTGKSLIYKLKGKGFIVYSLGESGKDYNGISDYTNPKNIKDNIGLNIIH